MITIWGRATSSNVQKVLWLCDELGLKFKRYDVGGPFGGLDKPEFLALNPNGTVPVVQDAGTVTWESHAIMRLLASKYGSDEIYPADPVARSHVDRWLDWHLGTLGPVINPVFIALYRTPATGRDEKVVAGLIARLTATMASLDRQMAGRAYIAGDNLTLADIAFGNSIWRWFAFPIERPSLPNLEAWEARVALRPGHQTHIAQPLS